MPYRNLFHYQQTLNFGGKIISLSQPLIMGVLNITTDSFSDGGKYCTEETILQRVGQMVAEGADIIDIGAQSTKPNATLISADDEMERLKPFLPIILKNYRNTIFSIDTFYTEVADYALSLGVGMINDISGGQFDFGNRHVDKSMATLAKNYGVPYLINHIQGTPQTMQKKPQYENITEEIYAYLVEKLAYFEKQGVYDLIVDVGFGFGKTYEHNLELLRKLSVFTTLGKPLLVGVSRKAFVKKLTAGITDQAEYNTDLVAMTNLIHLSALNNGANILRVHDVLDAVNTRKLWLSMTNEPEQTKIL